MVKISDLAAISALDDDDIFVVVEDGVSKKITLEDLSRFADDPIYRKYGTPTQVAFEFETSSMTGLTNVGTPDVRDSDTTVPGHLYVADNASGTAWCGVITTNIPAAPFTVITKVTDATTFMNASYLQVGLTLGEASPGAFDVLGMQWNSGQIRVDRYTSPTVFGSTIASISAGGFSHPVYYAIKVNSSSDVDYYASVNGYVWRRCVAARNPSLTLGSVGVGLSCENTNGMASAFAFLRVWNTALTFPHPG